MAPHRARTGTHGRRGRARRLLVVSMVAAGAAGLPSPVLASSGGGRRITDAENTRTVYLVVIGLILLAIALAVYTWWFWRSTKRDHEALAPLEAMADRKFVDGDATTRRTILDGNRPVGAAPLAPGASDPLTIVPEQPSITISAAVNGDETAAVPAVGDGAAGDAEAASDDRGAQVDEAEVDTGRTPAPVAVPDGSDATDEIKAAATDGAGPADGAALAVDAALAEDADLAEDAEPTSAGGDSTVASDGAAASDGDRSEQPTQAIDAVQPGGARPDGSTRTDARPTAIGAVDASPMPVIVPAVHRDPPAAEGEQTELALGVERVASTNGHPQPAALIDPGLPVPAADDPPARQLTLAELAALDGGTRGFDDDPLHATPSTGIPVVESPEAWVERELAAAKATRIEPTDATSDHGSDATGADQPDDGPDAGGPTAADSDAVDAE